MFSAMKEAYQAHLQYGYERLVIKSMFNNNFQTLISGWKKRHVALDVKRTKGGKRMRKRRKRRGSKRRKEIMGMQQSMRNNLVVVQIVKKVLFSFSAFLKVS